MLFRYNCKGLGSKKPKTTTRHKSSPQIYFAMKLKGRFFVRRRGFGEAIRRGMQVSSRFEVIPDYVIYARTQKILFSCAMLNMCSPAQFKDAKVFMGLVEAMTTAKDREIRGVGMQNFKYNPDYREFMALVNTISSHASRTMAQEFKVETVRSMKVCLYFFPDKILALTRLYVEVRMPQSHVFPIGIDDRTYEYAEKYCDEYQYPRNFPLGLSVDDTKVFASLQALQDRDSNGKGQWYLLGGVW